MDSRSVHSHDRDQGRQTQGGSRQPAASASALSVASPGPTSPEGEPAEATLVEPGPIRTWIEEHDHSWLFVGVYLGLAVVLSVFVSLFWLVFMAGVHLLLECIRHYRPGWGARDILTHSLWEVKLDFALVLLALALVLYVDIVLGVLGVQSAARAAAVTRAGAKTVTRMAAWERYLRGFLVTIDEIVRISRAAVLLRRGRPVRAAPAEERGPVYPWGSEWGLGDRISLGLIAICILLISATPLLTHYDWNQTLSALLTELQPFPS
ncbi:hypothetical protein BH23GEM8_BH23GEM8_16110 [soil metagenome]